MSDAETPCATPGCELPGVHPFRATLRLDAPGLHGRDQDVALDFCSHCAARRAGGKLCLALSLEALRPQSR